VVHQISYFSHFPLSNVIDVAVMFTFYLLQMKYGKLVHPIPGPFYNTGISVLKISIPVISSAANLALLLLDLADFKILEQILILKKMLNILAEFFENYLADFFQESARFLVEICIILRIFINFS
jgi:hypothetical protein